MCCEDRGGKKILKEYLELW